MLIYMFGLQAIVVWLQDNFLPLEVPANAHQFFAVWKIETDYILNIDQMKIKVGCYVMETLFKLTNVLIIDRSRTKAAAR